MSSDQAPPGTRAVRRALALLKALVSFPSGATLPELAIAVDLPRATTYRLMAAIEGEGMARRDPTTGVYRLGPAALSIGAHALHAYDLRRAARSSLEILAEESGETATLEFLEDGGRMQILDEVPGRFMLSVFQEIGTLWPVHATATGRAVLSQLPPERCRQLLRLPLQSYTGRTIIDPDKIISGLALVRERGFALNDGELEAGTGAVAAPLLGALGEVLGAISVGGPLSRLPLPRLRTLGDRVADEARRVSASLGYAEAQVAGASITREA